MHYVRAIQAAAMPELYSAMPSSPQVNVLYLAPGQTIISPEQLKAMNPEMLNTKSTARFAKISPSMLVKYGSHVSLIEAKNMLYVAENTSIPVPRLFAAYAYGPLDRDLNDSASVYDTYIFMEFIEGEDLEKSWAKQTSAEKQMISTELKKYMTEIRSLPAPGYIGSVHMGPVTDIMLDWCTTSRGPFESEEDFNTLIVDIFVAKSKTQIGPYIRAMVDAHKHEIVFTHGDFRPPNIIVKDGRVSAIIDWELSGWYPEYWEFAKAFFLEYFTNDWAPYLLDILTPYFYEHLLHARLMRVLW